jgi:glucose/arabinose dehydrogenase
MKGMLHRRSAPVVSTAVSSAAVAWLLLGALGASAQTATGLSWPGCADLQAGDFRKVGISINHPASPTKMKIAGDGRMFFAGTGGKVWSYDPRTAATTTLASIAVIGGGTAWGLVGMALDPAFLADNWIYLLYSAKPVNLPAAPVSYQLWRYTLAAGKLDAGKMILEYPADKGTFPVDHSGGGMAFDAQGNLYFSSGENSDWNLNYGNVDETRIEFNSLRTAGNTNDLRGKVNRIHPEPDGKYTIPAGNLFPPGKDSTKPEIYAMGFRNPWSLDVDKPTGTLLIADVGPQAEAASPQKGPAGMDEFNATRTPGFFGWPMFMGPNVAYNNYDYSANKAGAFFDKDAPINDSRWNTGLKKLPPAKPSIVAYGKDGLNNPLAGFERGGAVPITGPIYRYDGKNPSKIKLPPHFEGKWFVADAFQKWIKVIGLDDGAAKAVTVGNAFPGMATFASTSSYSIIAMEFGPDGALYVTENGSNVTFRIEYAGSCLPDVTPAIPNAVVRAGRMRAGSHGALLAPMGGRRAVALEEGSAGFALFDARGRKVWEYRREGAVRRDGAMPRIQVDVPAEAAPGSILRVVALD